MGENKTPKKKRRKRRKKCSQCQKLVDKLFDGLCSYCRDYGAKQKKEKTRKFVLMEADKKNDEWLLSKSEAMSSLQLDWRWKEYLSVVDLIKQKYARELLSPEFLNLDAVTKDRRHRVIYEILDVIDKLAALPAFLKNQTKAKWAEAEDIWEHFLKNKGGL